jgi:hypothetical protein
MSVIERERVEEVTREVTEADVLERAADLLEEWGHCKGRFHANGDSFCIRGAIEAALVDPVGYLNRRYELYTDRGGDLVRLLGFSENEAYDWNDNSRRTKQEVVVKLRASAAHARAQA